MTARAYRPDIDGLRAVAVLLAVGFHAYGESLPGAFIGVDIFFVISGYLITQIILDEKARGEFRFAQFYMRRVRRIFPALVTVLAASLMLGWVVLMGEEYRQLGKHVAWGAGFVSNIILARENGYFDNASETKPLLHLWTLSIEAQFYILAPVLFWLAGKKKIYLPLILLIGTASFVWNIAHLHSNAATLFYSLPMRGWELAAGMLLAMIVSVDSIPARWAEFFSFAGVMLIFAGICVTDKHVPFPGWYALLPVIGAMLFIAGGARSRANKILSHPVPVWIGRISYPLYLWHWPLLSCAYITGNAYAYGWLRPGIIALSVLLAWLTLRFVEQPLRFGAHAQGKVIALVCGIIAVGAAGYFVFMEKGMPWRMGDRQEFLDFFNKDWPQERYIVREHIAEAHRYECNFYQVLAYRAGHMTRLPGTISSSCTERDPAKKYHLLIWGDSHAQQLYSGLRHVLPENWQMLQVASSGCRIAMVPEDDMNDYCIHSNWVAFETVITAKPEMVLLAQSRDHNPKALNLLADKLRAQGVAHIVILGPTPAWSISLPRLVATQFWLKTPLRSSVGQDSAILPLNNRLRRELHQDNHVIYIDMLSFFCPQGQCLIYLGDDVKTGLISYDYSHLTPLASDYVAQEYLGPILVNAMQPR